MNKDKALPQELSFLTDFYDSDFALLKSAQWLRSDFDEPIWYVRTSKAAIKDTVIDFRVKLDDGLFLTHVKHKAFLDSLKSYLCLSSHPLGNGGCQYSSSSVQKRFNMTVSVIDYFLLRSKSFKLATHGFNLITPHDILEFVDVLASSQHVKHNIYRVYEEIRGYLLSNINMISEEEFNNVINDFPDIVFVDDTIRSHLGLSGSEIVASRVFLWLKGHYRYSPGEERSDQHSFFRHKVSLKSVFSEVFEHRTLVTPKFPNFPLSEFHFLPAEKTTREFPVVATTVLKDDPLPSGVLVGLYINTLKRMEVLGLYGLDCISQVSLAALDRRTYRYQLKMKGSGRYRSLPQDVVFESFKNAVEYYFDFSQSLIDGYLEIVRLANFYRCDISSLESREIIDVIPKKLKDAGVKVWDLSADHRGTNRGGGSAVFFSRFRSNEGLLQMIEVLYASIWIILATLTARRAGELEDLEVDNCIIERSHGFYLQFDLRKRNYGDKREKVIRPIPKLVAKCINSLRYLHYQFSLIRSVKVSKQLFRKPHYREARLVSMGPFETSKVLNRFCDYFEVKKDFFNHRYYIRTHQLRRFFATMFFWGDGFGGLETLRWCLGHSNVEHVYSYITESIPGEVLRRVGAEYASEAVIAGNENADELGKLLIERYGLSSFFIMQSDEVADYIEDLMISGEVSVEPHFVDVPGGKSYEILFKVIGASDE